ncbi:Rpn family recombination-promoting nuclease/putative transposase [Alicyclobacillus tolerans]|uniref:Rpn family recombination-promoting nuclease/putative transposase n=1 Tax=Alicyclobacillus tolerans TaxID=90970 RepID=UPI001F260F00|nr:Rpn family recombination-promoting nuclease/putative transposase [Alicyclobacillus tolerans]MCF8567045.1 Rpn family recombination-promoting nuclease/putative transposase [Alicyclobacillus tolerans]
MELLRPTVDFVFKRIFGTEENKDVLVDFLNAVFESAGQPQVSTVEILNPFIDKNALYDKMSILDVRARTESGTFINVEIQLWNRRDIEKRTLYYWAKMYSGQLQEGENYRKLNKTVTINVLDFDYIQNDRYHNIFHLREDISDIVLSDNLEIHVVELRKLKEQSVGMERRLVGWMLFLSARTKERLEELAVKEPAIKKAVTTLEFLSQDEEARRLYEERQRALHDYVSDIEGAREEGMEKGMEKGREEEKKYVAKQMLDDQIPVVAISKYTGLSIEDIEKLRGEIQ